ncbi:hypothetical protein EV195_102227 [Tenacibaculum skagerrakense]|uniref:Lipoprotein n=1 Tax=Tenacibaculum skagerrakense TaxID=186571 RepID=A0A4R2NZV6_9FLAO|nr:hypothetical protein [Tenacibaculum skagerrakense]TCP26885.1 hypothetical protein EV195_102227 [Tenacibaculum skagerrakense]
MRGTIYVFMSALLLTFIGCNNNEDVSLIENQESNLQQEPVVNSEERTVEQPDGIINEKELMELQDIVSEVQVLLPKEDSNTASKVVVIGDKTVLKTTDLIIGRNYKAGTVTVTLENKNILVTYKTNNCWNLWKTSLFIGDKEAIPLYRGYPNYTKFPYRESHRTSRIQEYTYTIPIAELKGIKCITLATHAKLSIYYRRWCWIYSAWGDGKVFEGTRCPATYFSLCDDNDDDDPVDTN